MSQHQPEHLQLARAVVAESHPELAAFEIKRCYMRERPSGRWFHVHVRHQMLVFEVNEKLTGLLGRGPVMREVKPRRRRKKAPE